MAKYVRISFPPMITDYFVTISDTNMTKKNLRSYDFRTEVYLFNYVFKRILGELLTHTFVDLFLQIAQYGLNVSTNRTILIRTPMKREYLAAGNRLIDLR